MLVSYGGRIRRIDDVAFIRIAPEFDALFRVVEALARSGKWT
ncbi:MAG: hypothetical protein ACLQLT_11280 [Methylovirgula sp.]